MEKEKAVLVLLVSVLYPLSFASVYLSGLSVNYSSFIFNEIAAIYLVVFIVPFCKTKGFNQARVMAECLAALLLMVFPQVMLAYSSIAYKLPLVDQLLFEYDRNVGIDFYSLLNFINYHPVFASSLKFAYDTFGTQIALVPVLLALFNYRAHAYKFVTAFGLTCLLSSLIAVWFPALGTYAYLSVNLSDYKNINGILGVAFVEHILAIRDNSGFVLSIDDVRGVLSFPSVHAATAVLCIWGTFPIRLLRIPFILINVLMLCSAFSEGGHYVIDILGGVTVALFSISVVQRASQISKAEKWLWNFEQVR